VCVGNVVAVKNYLAQCGDINVQLNEDEHTILMRVSHKTLRHSAAHRRVWHRFR
jgi:hypothetical protein